MFEEADLQPLSAISQLVFCERRFALIHIERIWEENQFTAEGKLLHERVDEGGADLREGVRIERGLPLRSLRLGLTGRADVVEFPPPPEPPFPVEFKRGKPGAGLSDQAQLCAQAMCLEEMLRVSVPRGALFYGLVRRRVVVEFTQELRSMTEQAANRMHELFRQSVTPAGVYESKCRGCSIIDWCLPRAVRPGRSAGQWLRKAIHEALNFEKA
ncbi:MAG: CRISPR-associated protein Cas4 [Bryobacteraceae bacterium]